MTFVSPKTFIEKLKNLRKNYEESKSLDLETAKQPCTMFRMVGCPNVVKRKKEFGFSDKWLALLDDDLKKEATDKHDEFINALKILTVVTLSLTSEIGNECTIPATARSKTLKLLTDALYEKREDNYMDDETRAACFFATKRFLSENKFIQINGLLKSKLGSHEMSQFSDREWCDFIKFVKTACDTYEGKNIKDNFPITRIMMPLCATPMQVIGTSAGWVFGDITSRTTTMLPVQGKIAVAIGYGMYMMMGATAGTGVLILTPTYAAKLIEAVSGFTLSWVCGVIMGATGNVVGWTIGMTLDLSWKLIAKGFNALINLGYDESKLAKISGYLLTDGRPVIEGVPFTPMCAETLNAHIPEGSLQIPYAINNDELTFTYNNEVTKISLANIKEQPYMAELIQLIESGQPIKAPPQISPQNDTTYEVANQEECDVFSECP